MACILLTLIAGAVILLCLYLYLTYTYWKRNGIPTAKGFYPLVGHLLPVIKFKEGFSHVVQKVYRDFEHSSMVGIYKGLRPALIIREPHLVKTVLHTNFSSFQENGSKIEKDVDTLLANNPFFTEGEEWATGRKRLTYAFTSSRLKSLFLTVNGVCKKLQNFLDRRLSSDNKYEVEMQYLFSKFTGEVVANAGLGIEGRCFENDDDPTAFDKIGQSLVNPTLFEKVLQQFMFLFPDFNRLAKIGMVSKEMDQMFRKIVTENFVVRQKEGTPRNDFLQLMMDLEKTEEKLDFEAVATHAFSFYADGFITSSITLSYIGYELALHQDVQQKLREEVMSVIQKYGNELTYEGLKEMTYMEQVISESQRCNPVLGAMVKVCTEAFTLEGSDGLKCRVKPGTLIVVPVSGLQHDPKYWPDPDTFDPDRFNEDRKGSIEKYTFLPFGEGPRMCVGMRIAMTQMKACLATLMKNYKLELSPKTQIPLKTTSILMLTSPVDNVWVNISKI
ncbi:probable cytochrome P450 6a13 [Ceratina calcarata]|uniref:Probable cytochrome P450 6a13 n=1 Tax=Ceratina calcarata TaxID=156304 RepID=A0AAJ7J4Z0_9HYME|nr:probable cytochrome P450 6a13 [Ceratina calcarata]